MANLFALYLLYKTIDMDLGPKIQDELRNSPISSLTSNSYIGCKYTHRTRKIISIAATVLITIRKNVLLDTEKKLNQLMDFAILRAKLFYIYVSFTKILTLATLLTAV